MQLAAFLRRQLLPTSTKTVFPGTTLTAKGRERNAMIRRRFALESPSRAPVAQWIEQPPPKGQVGRSIRLWGAKLLDGQNRSCFGAAAQKRVDFLDQSLELNWLQFVVVTASGNRLLAAFLRCIGGDNDDRDVFRFRLAFQTAGRLPAVQPRKSQVHYDEIGQECFRPIDPLCAIRGYLDLEPGEAQALMQREEAVLAVLDAENLDHPGSPFRPRCSRPYIT